MLLPTDPEENAEKAKEPLDPLLARLEVLELAVIGLGGALGQGWVIDEIHAARTAYNEAMEETA